MPREMSTAMEAWLAQSLLPVALFFTGTFSSGPIYIWTGLGVIDWNGHTWIGIGTLGAISPIAEGSSVEARGITVSLSGFDPVLLAEVLNEFVLGEPMTIYLAGFNEGVIIVDPLIAFAGELDQPTIDADGETATISINCESRLLDIGYVCGRRYTQEDQQRDWPGDLAFMFVDALQESIFYWGLSPSSTANI
jgi:hypothetical protein